MVSFRDDDFISEVMSIESTGIGKVVTVKVIGPTAAPDFLREFRARGRALMSVGAVPTAVDTVGDLLVGDIKRLTETVSGPKEVSRGNFFVGQEFKIRVNNE